MEQEKKLIPNSTQIPNVLLDIIIPQISEADGKCLLYICRRTYGFHKERDRISLSQFVDGIKNKDGKQLDCGAGLSRPAVVEALKNLVGSGLVKRIETPAGNYYEIDLDIKMDVENPVDNEVVKEVNQLRKLTKTGKESKPKQVKLLNPQKKGNKEKQSNGVIIKKIGNERLEIPVGDPPPNREPNPAGLKKYRNLKIPLLKKYEFTP